MSLATKLTLAEAADLIDVHGADVPAEAVAASVANRSEQPRPLAAVAPAAFLSPHSPAAGAPINRDPLWLQESRYRALIPTVRVQGVMLTSDEHDALQRKYDSSIPRVAAEDMERMRPVGVVAGKVLIHVARAAITDRTQQIAVAEQDALALAEKKSTLESSNPDSCMIDGYAQQLNAKQALIERFSHERADFQTQLDALVSKQSNKG